MKTNWLFAARPRLGFANNNWLWYLTGGVAVTKLTYDNTFTSTNSAAFEDGSVSVEAGIADMLIRMESGRFKVFKHLTDWFDEYRLYHRKDGRVHKEGDDLMSATRYAVMMLRHARTDIPPRPRSPRWHGRSWMSV